MDSIASLLVVGREDGTGQGIDAFLGQQLRELSRFRFRQKLLAGVPFGTLQRREGLRRPKPLQVRMAVRCPRRCPRVSHRGLRPSTQGYRRQDHGDDKQDALHRRTSMGTRPVELPPPINRTWHGDWPIISPMARPVGHSRVGSLTSGFPPHWDADYNRPHQVFGLEVS